MKIGPLKLFERMHCNGQPSKTILIASWHWKWSITWRFHISWTPRLEGRVGFYFSRVYKHQPGLNFHTGFNIPVLGSFSIQTQPNMSTNRTSKTEGAPK